MAITGHTLTLSWNDFQGTVPNHATRIAFTSTSYSVSTLFTFSIVGEQRSNFRLSDVQIRVILNRDRMWAQRFQRTEAVLRHEQGHYEITALSVRDLHTDLDALRQSGRTFASQQELQQAVAALQQEVVTLETHLQSTSASDGLYDQQTNHGLNTQAQSRWDAAFRAARSSATSRLRDVLWAHGITQT